MVQNQYLSRARFLFEISQHESKSQMPGRKKEKKKDNNTIYVGTVGEKEKQQLYYHNKSWHRKDEYQYVYMFFYFLLKAAGHILQNNQISVRKGNSFVIIIIQWNHFLPNLVFDRYPAKSQWQYLHTRTAKTTAALLAFVHKIKLTASKISITSFSISGPFFLFLGGVYMLKAAMAKY